MVFDSIVKFDKLLNQADNVEKNTDGKLKQFPELLVTIFTELMKMENGFFYCEFSSFQQHTYTVMCL